jgi:serine/threonine protein kinase
MMIFNDIFVNDRYYRNLETTDDLQISNVIGSGSQFTARILRLPPGTITIRKSGKEKAPLKEGQCLVLKRPVLALDENDRFVESETIRSIVTELRVICHPALRHHPRILDVYGFAWEREDNLPGVSVSPLVAVEYGEFGTLDEYLAGSHPLSLDDKLRLASDVAHGVDAIHQLNIVHSDLKASNILVCKGLDGSPVAKLSDFGLAIILEERPSPSVWKSGTYPWMAPEWKTQLRNDQLISTDSKSTIRST